MDNRQYRTLKAFDSVLGYLASHPVQPEPPLLGAMRRKLRAGVSRIRAYESEQRKALSERDTGVDKRRKALRRDRMMPLVRIARPLLKFAPGAESALRVPHARADAKTVADAASRMADMLAPHTRLLVSAGCDKAFLKDFKREARELALTVRTSQKARQRASASTAAIAAEFKKGMQVLDVIEGIVMLKIGSDKDALRQWRWCRRVRTRMGRPRVRKRAVVAVS